MALTSRIHGSHVKEWQPSPLPLPAATAHEVATSTGNPVRLMIPKRMLVVQPKATAVKLGTTTRKHYRDSICAVFPNILSDTANTDLEWSPRDIQHLVF